MRRITDRLDETGPYAALLLTCALGWAFKAQCGAGWTGGEQYTSGCYNDAVPFWHLRGVAAGALPYVGARMEYPVLTGLLIYLQGGFVRLAAGAQADAADFLNVVVLTNAILAFAVLEIMRNAGVPLARRYGWALAPPLVLYLGHNWDMLAIGFAVAAMVAAARGVEQRATVLAALGTAAKLFPVLLLPLLGLQALVTPAPDLRRRIARAIALAAIAIAAWGAVNLPVAAVAFRNWSEFYAFSGERPGTVASLFELAARFGWWDTDVPSRNLWSFLFFAAGAAAIVAAGWRRHGAHPWLLFTPVLAWFLLTNKVYSPQFDLWLWPMLVLTGTRVRPMALFLLGDVACYVAEFWFFAGIEGASPAATEADVLAAVLVRAAALLWLIHAAVTDAPPGWITRRRAAPPPEGRPTPAG